MRATIINKQNLTKPKYKKINTWIVIEVKVINSARLGDRLLSDVTQCHTIVYDIGTTLGHITLRVDEEGGIVFRFGHIERVFSASFHLYIQ